jgi:uncharacterized membrane protein YGL010W
MFEDLQAAYKYELSFYRENHQNRINWNIHCICIPLEWLSWFLLCSYICNPLLIAGIVATYYMIVGSPGSVKASFSVLIMSHSGVPLLRSLSPQHPWVTSLLVQIVAWFLQVGVGHRYFEKNTPGMLKKMSFNSVVLSLLMTFESRIG